jgi:hypothetical protein
VAGQFQFDHVVPRDHQRRGQDHQLRHVAVARQRRVEAALARQEVAVEPHRDARAGTRQVQGLQDVGFGGAQGRLGHAQAVGHAALEAGTGGVPVIGQGHFSGDRLRQLAKGLRLHDRGPVHRQHRRPGGRIGQAQREQHQHDDQPPPQRPGQPFGPAGAIHPLRDVHERAFCKNARTLPIPGAQFRF